MQIALIDPEDEQVHKLQEQIPEWTWKPIDPETLIASEAVDLSVASTVIIFAKKDKEDWALKVCKRLKRRSDCEDTPVLMAITLYQMPLGNDAKRLPNTDFIFTPLKVTDVKQRITEMQGSE